MQRTNTFRAQSTAIPALWPMTPARTHAGLQRSSELRVVAALNYACRIP